jgi:hypothetical protein
VTNELHPNLHDFGPSRIEQVLGDVVSPAFRVRQIADWLQLRGVDSFDAMTDIPKDVRTRLAERFTVELPAVVERTTPAADGSQKYLFALRDGNRIESVYMPMRDGTSIVAFTDVDSAITAPSVTNHAAPNGRYVDATTAIGALASFSCSPRITPKATTDIRM